MHLRHLQAFIVLAEELHFGRAAKRLHMEQSPLSRTIRKLEAHLGVPLFIRTSREIRLTREGHTFLVDAQRVNLAAAQAEEGIRAMAAGYKDTLRIGIANGVGPGRLSSLLVTYREEAPEVKIRLYETTPPQLLNGLRLDLFDAGLTLTSEAQREIVSLPVWHDALVVLVPLRHPLLAHREVPLDEVLSYPLIVSYKDVFGESDQRCERLFRLVDMPTAVAERVASHALMVSMVAAGYGVGFSTVAHIGACRHAEVVARPLAAPAPSLTTCFVRPRGAVSNMLQRFIEQVHLAGQTDTGHHRQMI